MKKPSVLLLMLILAAVGTRAADSDPSHFTPVSWILQTQHNGDVDDKFVTLRGKVVKPDQGSDWWFSDTTGSVRLDTGEKDLPVGTWLVVSGNIDQAKLGMGYLEVEVKHWDYADKRR